MKKSIGSIMLLCIVLACSKEKNISNPLDNSRPSVIQTAPASGAYAVSKFASLSITFSENIDKDSVSSSSFVITPPIPFSFVVSGNQVRLIPQSPLPDGQKFFVIVKAGIRDPAGNLLENDYSFYFRVDGINYSQAQVTFRVDNSIGKNYFRLFLAGSFDQFGDYDPSGLNSTRYALYDDGLHNDNAAGDGIWGLTANLTADNYHQYSFAVDEDEDPNNGSLKSSSFFVLSTAPKTLTLYLYPPLPVTFNYYDREGKVTQSIFLKGQFNSWANTDPMSGPEGPDRKFSVTKVLKEGTYNYKYYVDYDWDKVNPDNRTITVTYPVTADRNDYDQGGYNVMFDYYDVEHKVLGDVYLKGDFNGWGSGNRMTGPQGPSRRFITSVNVVAGRTYSYKYYADSDWDKLNVDNRSVVIQPGQSVQEDYYTGPLDITFLYYDFEAKVTTSILITGDFNGWTTSSPLYQMTQDAVTNYKYSITLPLVQGTHLYKYFADNDWNKLNMNNRSVYVSSTNSSVVRDVYQP